MSFDTEMAGWSTQLKESLDNKVKEIAADIFVDIVQRSPTPNIAPYAEGSFILSHRISGGAPDDSFTMVEDIHDEARGEAYDNEIPKLDSMPAFETIHISNSVPHAEDVEFIGWGPGTPPYQVYSSAENIMEQSAQNKLATIP